MKKILSMLLVFTLIISLLSACGSDDAKDDTSGNSSTSTKDDGGTTSDEPLSLPLKEQVKMTVFVHTRPNVDDFDNNEFTKWLEEQSNIDLEFIVAPENEGKEKLNLLLSTGDYPDIIITKQLNTAQIAYYGSQGVFLPMNDMIDQYGDNTKTAFEMYPLAKDLFTMADGNIYNLPEINNCYHCEATQKLWVYQPWLDALDIDMPQTTEEFHDMLLAFKNDDPNGNGLQDEVPLSGAIKGWEPEVEGFLMNAFTYNATNQSGAKRLFVQDGNVAASYMQEGWKEGLEYLQMLRKEGLLDPNAFTQDNEALKQLGENPGDNILGVAPGGFMGNFCQIEGESGRWENWTTIPPLEGPNGVRTAKYNPFVGQSGISITDACENPEAAFLLADLMYSEEATFRNTIGRPEVEWTYSEAGAIGLNGEAAIWTELIPINSQDPNVSWQQLGPNLRSSTWRLGRESTENQKLEVILYEETKNNYAPYYPDPEILLPPLVLSEDQSATLLTYSTTIDNYVEEKIAYFILNDVDVSAEWDSYVAELEAMGIHELLAVYQEAYDAR